jgi:hypothetical protein
VQKVILFNRSFVVVFQVLDEKKFHSKEKQKLLLSLRENILPTMLLSISVFLSSLG